LQLLLSDLRLEASAMQKFTRALTREIEVAGERLAVTLSAEGLSVRPVGSRRQPYTMSWAAWVTACTQPWAANYEPTPEEATAAVEAMKAGKVVNPADVKSAPAVSPSAVVAPPSHAPNGLAGLLARLDKWLTAHRHNYHKGLRHGATPAELDELEKEAGCLVPGELRTWLGWHNGQDAETVGALEGRWIPMSTKEIAEVKKERDANPVDGWKDTWLPFLDDDRGNYLCIDTHEAGHPLRECREGHSTHHIVAHSLTAWVERFVKALEEGKYHEDSERGTFFQSV
jgi:cell wall assembly regulator SMI1